MESPRQSRDASNGERGEDAADALVIAAGSDFCRDPNRLLLGDATTIICADGGIQACLALGLSPSILIGDMDSAPGPLMEWARDKGARILKFPADKDQTDMELALNEAVSLGSKAVLVTGATGGRADHTLANVDLCLRYAGRGLQLTAVEEWGEIFFLAGFGRAAHIIGNPGDTVSLLPRCVPARGVHTDGLYFKLDGDTLEYGQSRGVSNYMTTTSASVRMDGGEMLVVHLGDSQLGAS